MSPRPRILLLSTAYLPLVGGSELAIRHIAERLPEYDFDLVTGRHRPDMPVYEQMGRIRVFRAGGRLARLSMLLPKNLLPLPIALTAWRLMRRHHYALVHAYQASQAGGAAWLLRILRPGTPLLLTIQEGKNLDTQSFLTRFFRSYIIRSANRVTVISSYLADYVRRYTRVPVNVIPNGVSLQTSHVRIQNPDPTILTVSRLVQKNNINGLIRAFVLARETITNVRLLIVGDGPLRSALEALSAQLGVRDAVQFMGTVPHDNLQDIYSMADIFVRPSLSEGLGSVFLEAMAAGVPVVASAVGGIPDIVHDGTTGLVCDPNDSASIAAAIVRLWNDSALREHIVQTAKHMVRERYTWEAVARQMGEVYTSMAS